MSPIQRTNCVGCGAAIAWIPGVKHPVNLPPEPYDPTVVGYVLSRTLGWMDSGSCKVPPPEHLVAHAYVCRRWQDTRDPARTPLTVGGQR